jgi:hypothetical protein
MTGAGWHIRPGSPTDRELLASFTCADPAVQWQAEVEHFIQAQLTDWAFDPHADAGDPRLLLAFNTAGTSSGSPRTSESSSGQATAPASLLRSWRSWE